MVTGDKPRYDSEINPTFFLEKLSPPPWGRGTLAFRVICTRPQMGLVKDRDAQ